jgi:hypothetical protein
MRLGHAVEEDVDLNLLAPADVDAVMLVVFKTAIVRQLLVRVLHIYAPFVGFELAKMAFFAKAFDERPHSFIFRQLKAADLFLSTNVDMYVLSHIALVVTLCERRPGHTGQ